MRIIREFIRFIFALLLVAMTGASFAAPIYLIWHENQPDEWGFLFIAFIGILIGTLITLYEWYHPSKDPKRRERQAKAPQQIIQGYQDIDLVKLIEFYNKTYEVDKVLPVDENTAKNVVTNFLSKK